MLGADSDPKFWRTTNTIGKPRDTECYFACMHYGKRQECREPDTHDKCQNSLGKVFVVIRSRQTISRQITLCWEPTDGAHDKEFWKKNKSKIETSHMPSANIALLARLSPRHHNFAAAAGATTTRSSPPRQEGSRSCAEEGDRGHDREGAPVCHHLHPSLPLLCRRIWKGEIEERHPPPDHRRGGRGRHALFILVMCALESCPFMWNSWTVPSSGHSDLIPMPV
jgi:hypothetical protein